MKKKLIPYYFEPLIMKNVNINVCIFLNKYKQNLTIFKGDGDQDRPNLL